DLTCLVKLPKLTKLNLKDPLYHPCPASQLCNYSTHIMYHLPNLVSLDTIDITCKQLADLAEGTVNKKKMFYNMRAKTIQRNMSDLLARLESAKKELLEVPNSRLRTVMFAIKEMERLLDTGGTADMYDSDPESERDVRKPVDKKFAYKAKLDALKQRRLYWEVKSNNIESYAKMSEVCIRQMADMMINRLLVELETGGNVRFEDGRSSDPWFTSCHDLVLSRFCAYDYRDLGVVGIKIHRIIRIHNRMLRTRFDKSIIAITENSKGEYYPGSKNTAYKKSLEYLFWMSDPEMVGGSTESYRIPEEGFMDAETYMQCGREGAVPLSNSISLADRRRIAHCIKMNRDREDLDNCPFRHGLLIVAKTHLGKSVVAKGDKRICKANYSKMDSVFKPRKNCIPKEKVAEENDCECSARQCEWYIFNNNLVLPEYIIEFEYITKVKSMCPFQHLSEDLLNEQPQKHAQIPVAKMVDNSNDFDDDILKMDPEIKPRSRMVTLSDELILRLAKVDTFNKITTLNLHGNGLTKLRQLQHLVSLKRLVVSFNELTRLDELSNMQLQCIDASFNKIYTLEGMKGLYYIEELNVSWNKLVNTREELSILRKHLSNLCVLDIRNNPWLKAKDLRYRAIGRLRNLRVLDGKRVDEDEIALALRCAAGSRISQLSLLTYSRTDTVVPRSLSLADSAHIITMISRNKPVKESDSDVFWYTKITSLNLDSQHITKLSNLDRLCNLKYASFNNNDLTRIEGLDNCIDLLELSLANNCIPNLDGLQKLVSLQRLDLSHNCLTTIDTGILEKMENLTFLALESNRLTGLSGLQRSTALVELYIGNNNISNIREVFLLKSLHSLVILDMYGNPMVSEVENYRLFVIYHLKSLKALDGSAIAPRDIRKEMALYQKTQATLDLLLLDMNNSSLQEAVEGNVAKDTFDGRLTVDFIVEKMGHTSFCSMRELDLPNCGLRAVNLGTADQFLNLRSVNLEHNSLQSLAGLIYLVNLKVLCLNNNHIECILPKPKGMLNNQGKNRIVLSAGSKTVDSTTDNCTSVLPNLEVLHLGYNGIKDLAALQLSRLPSLKALFLQGNEISKVEGLEDLHNLKELVLDKNKIRQLSENSFTNLISLQELHLEDNRLRDLTGLGCLHNLSRLYLGNNRIQELTELDKIETLQHLMEISLVNNAITQRSMYRFILVHFIPCLRAIDNILITDEERSLANRCMNDITQQSPVLIETPLPGIARSKPNVQVKVTNMQLPSTPIWNNTAYCEDDSGGQRGCGRAKVQLQELGHSYGLTGGGNSSNTTLSSSNNRKQNSGSNYVMYPSSQKSDVETINRLNQQTSNKR
ncbi:unnamed protein product, partial [Candidula unifasciata]